MMELILKEDISVFLYLFDIIVVYFHEIHTIFLYNRLHNSMKFGSCRNEKIYGSIMFYKYVLVYLILFPIYVHCDTQIDYFIRYLCIYDDKNLSIIIIIFQHTVLKSGGLNHVIVHQSWLWSWYILKEKDRWNIEVVCGGRNIRFVS